MRLAEAQIRRIVRRTLLESGTQVGTVDPREFTPMLVKMLEKIALPDNIPATHPDAPDQQWEEKKREDAFQKLAEQDRAIERLVSYYNVIMRVLVLKISPGLVMPPATKEKVISVILNSVTDEYDIDNVAHVRRQADNAEDIAGGLISSITSHIFSALHKQFMFYIHDNPELTQDEMRAAGRELRDKFTRIADSSGARMYADMFDNDQEIDDRIQFIRSAGGHIVR